MQSILFYEPTVTTLEEFLTTKLARLLKQSTAEGMSKRIIVMLPEVTQRQFILDVERAMSRIARNLGVDLKLGIHLSYGLELRVIGAVDGELVEMDLYLKEKVTSHAVLLEALGLFVQ